HPMPIHRKTMRFANLIELFDRQSALQKLNTLQNIFFRIFSRLALSGKLRSLATLYRRGLQTTAFHGCSRREEMQSAQT
ncbi:MAG: hypothetical protein V1784_12550, partial [bacterium]